MTLTDEPDQPEHDDPEHDEPEHDEPEHDDPEHDDPEHDEPEHDDPADALWAGISADTRQTTAALLGVSLDLADGDDTVPCSLRDVYFEAARPRDHTHDRIGMAHVVRNTAEMLVDRFPGTRGAHRLLARELVEVAGREHGFCTARVTSVGAGYDPNRGGPLLCGAPLGTDSRRHFRAHTEVIERDERHRALRRAGDALADAVRAQVAAGQGETAHSLLDGLQTTLAAVRVALRERDEAAPDWPGEDW